MSRLMCKWDREEEEPTILSISTVDYAICCAAVHDCGNQEISTQTDEILSTTVSSQPLRPDGDTPEGTGVAGTTTTEPKTIDSPVLLDIKAEQEKCPFTSALIK